MGSQSRPFLHSHRRLFRELYRCILGPPLFWLVTREAGHECPNGEIVGCRLDGLDVRTDVERVAAAVGACL
jgi:hypothetical protein